MNAPARMDPDVTARSCADRMWVDDRASRFLGFRIDAIGPGIATLSFEVTETMINGHNLCHGGFIFTLADSAFAFACNSRNARAVAQHCAITFVASAQRGDRLTAVAEERGLSGRSGLYDATVRNQHGEVIAEFRGHSRTIPGQFFPEQRSFGTAVDSSSAG